jgi:hypothetical protein
MLRFNHPTTNSKKLNLRCTNLDIESICAKLLRGNIGEKALQVSLDEFQRFYSTFVNLTKSSPVVSLVNIEDTVIAQFSNISPQHFLIVEKESLLENDFRFIQNRRWYGAKVKPEKFFAFLWKEFKNNFNSLILVGLVSFTLLFWVNNDGLYQLLVSLLIQSSTVFLGLYIIFTVSQSQKLYQDLRLFKSGILHKYFRDDKNVTMLGILTISSTFLNSGVIYLLSGFTPNLLAQITKALFSSITVVLLFDTFLTVANYYLERNRDVIERDIVAEILHEDYHDLSSHE